MQKELESVENEVIEELVSENPKPDTIYFRQKVTKTLTRMNLMENLKP
jgi:hypothetical protein